MELREFFFLEEEEGEEGELVEGDKREFGKLLERVFWEVERGKPLCVLKMFSDKKAFLFFFESEKKEWELSKKKILELELLKEGVEGGEARRRFKSS